MISFIFAERTSIAMAKSFVLIFSVGMKLEFLMNTIMILSSNALEAGVSKDMLHKLLL